MIAPAESDDLALGRLRAVTHPPCLAAQCLEGAERVLRFRELTMASDLRCVLDHEHVQG